MAFHPSRYNGLVLGSNGAVRRVRSVAVGESLQPGRCQVAPEVTAPKVSRYEEKRGVLRRVGETGQKESRRNRPSLDDSPAIRPSIRNGMCLMATARDQRATVGCR